MKMIKNILCIVILLIASLCNGMEPESRDWMNVLKQSILGSVDQFFLYIKSEPSEPFNFVGLPLELQHHIISLLSQYSNATSLKEAGQVINSLARTNKKLNLLMNEPQFCFDLIRFLAKKFKTSDEDAARAVATKEVQRQFSLQKKLYLCVHGGKWKKSKEQIVQLCKDGADINFIYKSGKTLLMTAAKNLDIPRFDFLIEQGADINFANNKGVTALMVAAESASKYELHADFQKLINRYKNFNINQQDLKGNTALMYVLQITPINIEIIKILVDAGAHPELPNFAGVSPLEHVKKIKKSLISEDMNPIIDLFEQAIPKK